MDLKPTNGVIELQMPISDITIGTRSRHNVGDIAQLAASMKEIGLLQPVVVRPGGQLIAGFRRIAAVKLLGWDSIPVRVVSNINDALASMRAERDENCCRKDLAPSEAVRLAKAFAPQEQAAAKQRLKEAGGVGGKHKGSKEFSDPSQGRVMDRLAAYVRMSPPTLRKAIEICDVAEQRGGEYAALVEEMDASYNVSRAYARFESLQDAERLAKAAADLQQRSKEELDRDYRICCADFRDFFSSLDKKADLILADIPETKNLALIEDFAGLAVKHRAAGGRVAVMVGVHVVLETGKIIERYVPYCYQIAYLLPDQTHKVVLVFGDPNNRCCINGTTVQSDPIDPHRKACHQDAQDLHGFTRLIEKLSHQGEFVVDAFVGTGTTAVACLRTNRLFAGCDIDKKYVEFAQHWLNGEAQLMKESEMKLLGNSNELEKAA